MRPGAKKSSHKANSTRNEPLVCRSGGPTAAHVVQHFSVTELPRSRVSRPTLALTLRFPSRRKGWCGAILASYHLGAGGATAHERQGTAWVLTASLCPLGGDVSL